MNAKKLSLCAILVGTMVTVVAVTGCSSSKTSTQTDVEQGTETQEETGEETGGGEDLQKESEPEEAEVILPSYLLESARDALADGGYSVAFTADNLVQKDAGYELTVEVYEYDRYEEADIEKLEAGSKIQFCKDVVMVEEIEKDSETGFISINGGIENGGLDLRKEDGMYRTAMVNDYPVFYSVGQVTIPLSEEAVLEDHADLEKEPDGEVYEFKDLPAAIANSDILFNCNNTAITVRGEQIVQIIRYWVP